MKDSKKRRRAGACTLSIIRMGLRRGKGKESSRNENSVRENEMGDRGDRGRERERLGLGGVSGAIVDRGRCHARSTAAANGSEDECNVRSAES